MWLLRGNVEGAFFSLASEQQVSGEHSSERIPEVGRLFFC